MNRYGFISSYEMPQSVIPPWYISVHLGNGRGSGKTHFLTEICKELAGEGRRVGVLIEERSVSAVEHYRRISPKVHAEVARDVVRHANDIFMGRRFDDILVDSCQVLYYEPEYALTFMHSILHRMKDLNAGRMIIAHDIDYNKIRLTENDFNFGVEITNLPPHPGPRPAI